MSKPILNISITTLDEKTGAINAVFDSGSHYSIIREDKVPEGSAILTLKTPEQFRAASKGSKLTVTGEISLIMTIGDKMIKDAVLISPDLVREMLVGAKTMQAWDISIQNVNGETKVVVGLDMRDPDVTAVD